MTAIVTLYVATSVTMTMTVTVGMTMPMTVTATATCGIGHITLPMTVTVTGCVTLTVLLMRNDYGTNNDCGVWRVACDLRPATSDM